VLSARNAPRVNDVNFDIRASVVVPSHVHVVGVSSFPVLVEAFPRYRDDSFFVTGEQIVVVDHSRRIVDVIPVGGSGRYGHARGSTTTSDILDLSGPEIRQVQQVLIERGYYRGPVNGVFGPRMREALIRFQRKEGYQASGRIDVRTVSALGLSGRVGPSAAGANQPANQAGTPNTSDRSGRDAVNQRSNPDRTGGPSDRTGTTGQRSSSGENRSQNQPSEGANNSADKAPNASNQGSQTNEAADPSRSSPSSGSSDGNRSSQNHQSSPRSTTGQGNDRQGRGGSVESQSGTHNGGSNR